MATTMSSFRPVNSNLAPPESGASDDIQEVHTPTTPRPNARFTDQFVKDASSDTTNPITPTRHDFGGIPGQRALPDTPFSPSQLSEAHTPSSGLRREESHRSTHSHASNDSGDIEMADDDEGEDESDNDSVTSDSQRPKKKKKGQRFFCTDFPPCQLSFTRSEHLARHIRKHTGERPFQCHCSRRFSRLDNLRQHAQTVHVNEEIPAESLAATGTRFQRQIRTDRVRPPNNRSRASTSTSQGGHSRGHSRNLSASSVASTSSNVSIPEEGRRRPPPLAMAQDGAPRARLTLETFVPPGSSPVASYGYYNQGSPSGYSTPTSATFSTGPTSPRFAQAMQSPSSNISRSSFYNGSRAPARRLSVPSAPVPYAGGPYGSPHQSTYYSPGPSNTGSILASPTGSVFSHGRRESDAELDWRRRTWHPGTYASYVARPATSGLTYHSTPDDHRPSLASQPAASQITRLPGIESFDRHPGPPSADPPRQAPSPMQIDNSGRPPVYPGPLESNASGPDDRRNNPVWEAGLHHNLNRLDIANTTPIQQTASYAEQGPARHASLGERPAHGPHVSFSQPFASTAAYPANHNQAADSRKDRRQGWYGGPGTLPPGSQPIMIAHQRPSPEDSGSSDGVPTPSTSHGTELHPAIRHANGMIEMAPPGYVPTEEHQKVVQIQTRSKPEPTRADSGFQSYASYSPNAAPGAYHLQAGHDQQPQIAFMQPPQQRASNDMGRLEALVAVATSENRAVEQRP